MATNKTGGGSQTALVRQIRRTKHYYEWKKAVHIRDSFTCQQCGARNGRKRVIEAHHIKGLAELVKENNLLTLEEVIACPALWEVANGRTLCRSCHQQTESYPKQLRKTKKIAEKGPKVLTIIKRP